MSLWETEFPDFERMPRIPPEWKDQSWHNDICPSFLVQGPEDRNAPHTLVWVDYASEARRELTGRFRYCVCFYNDDNSDQYEELETDDWSRVLRYVAAIGRLYGLLAELDDRLHDNGYDGLTRSQILTLRHPAKHEQGYAWLDHWQAHCDITASLTDRVKDAMMNLGRSG